MEIQIDSVHIDNDDKLRDYIEKKVQKLEKFYDNIIDAHVYLKHENEKGNMKEKHVEIKLNIPQSTLFAEDKSESFEKSVDNVTESLERQIKKHKDKLRNR